MDLGTRELRRMFLVQQIAPGAIVAMLVAAALCAMARWLGWSRREWLGSVPLGLGYACGHMIVREWTGFPPVDATNWLFFFALAAVPLGSIGGSSVSVRVRAIIATTVSAAVLLLLLRPKFQYAWSPLQSSAWIAGLAALTVLHWLSLDTAVRRRGNDGIELPVFMLIPPFGASIALFFSGTNVLGQLSIVLASALLGATFTKSLRLPFGHGVVAVSATIFSSLLVSGYFYAELPAASALLLWATPLAALIRRDTSIPIMAAVRVGMLLSCVTAAVFLALRASPALDY